MKTLLSFFFILGLNSLALAQTSDEPTPLDPPYENLHHPKVVENFLIADFFGFKKSTNTKSAVESLIADQTPVKSQVERGTCSIFSATALLESRLIQRGDFKEIDLSEEWLQYLISQTTSSGGSYSSKNFVALFDYGQPVEKTLPYSGTDWKDINALGAKERCGHLTEAFQLGSCLTSHRDPALFNLAKEVLIDFNSPYYDTDFYFARSEALENKEVFFSPDSRYDTLWSTGKIKQALDEGHPLTMDITFYYGAWNHRLTEELGIHRDLSLWSQGIITYPEVGSMDYRKSLEKRAGHSVVIVGYDNDRTVEYTVNMEDGSLKTFKRKGVYYFKNSWGTSNFGNTFSIGDTIYPGYGMITQDYANQYGSFYKLTLN